MYTVPPLPPPSSKDAISASQLRAQRSRPVRGAGRDFETTLAMINEMIDVWNTLDSSTPHHKVLRALAVGGPAEHRLLAS